MGLLFFGLFAAPVVADHAAAAVPLHAAMTLDADQGQPGHADFGHPTGHCTSTSCTASFLTSASSGPVSSSDAFKARLHGGDGPDRSLIFDRDPPVPRAPFPAG